MSSSGDLPDPGIEPASPAAPALQVDSLPLSHWAKPPFIHLPLNVGTLFVFVLSTVFLLSFLSEIIQICGLSYHLYVYASPS